MTRLKYTWWQFLHFSLSSVQTLIFKKHLFLNFCNTTVKKWYSLFDHQKELKHNLHKKVLLFSISEVIKLSISYHSMDFILMISCYLLKKTCLSILYRYYDKNSLLCFGGKNKSVHIDLLLDCHRNRFVHTWLKYHLQNEFFKCCQYFVKYSSKTF